MPRRDEFDIGQPSVQNYPCDYCKKMIINAVVPRCCDGYGYGWGACGCYGKPTEPVTCSAKCDRKLMAKYRKGRTLECPDCFRGSNDYPVAECCGHALPSGECCGNAVQKMCHEPCQTCNATGYIKRPSWKKKKPSYTKIYRGILIEVRTGYANPRLKSMQVCVHTPDIERYFKSTAGVRRFISKVLNHENAIIIVAWGAYNKIDTTRILAINFFKKHRGYNFKCLGINKDGSPKHPLFLSFKTELIDYKSEIT